MVTPLDEAVDLVVAFANTLDVEDGTDQLATAADFSAWLAEHGGAASEVEETLVGRARDLRQALRAIAARDEDAPALEVPMAVGIAADGNVALVADDPVGRIAAAIARLAIEGRLVRVKICPADDCRWTFYDRSRNGSRQWCSMQVCGNRAKVRASRARSRSDGR